ALSGRPLLAQAPTGIGKTIGTLFPMLKAMPGQQLDKLYCLSAKTSGRSLMVDALQRVKQQAPALPLRVLELVARDKACEHPDKACHGESCPLAKGFYDRLPAARRDAAQAGMLNQQALRAIGLAHEICPYYLGQEMARWSDVIAGDYNYYFDLGAMLHGMAQQSGWRTAVLVDEAHNLLERGRKMYSAELDPASLREAQLAAPAQLAKVLARVDRQWSALAAGFEGDYAICDLPDKLLLALQQAVSAITDLLSEQATALGPALQRFYFDALHFTRVAELFDHHSQFDLTRPEHAASRRPLLCLRNLIPAPFLRPRFGAAQACVLFSATLSPWHFYADTLGLPDTTAWVDIAPAFRPEQLAVKIVTDVSTRYADRDASLAPIAALIGAQFMQAPGNYLAFFSSYDYLQKALAAFRAAWPAVPVWEQQRRMDETARNAFLARFVEDGQGIGFAVLGGVFGEGIDLPGTRLVGAFIATLGLPQVNPVNEALSACMAQRFGASVAYDYTYFFPGLQKVVQAAGRVIRNESDRGVLMLIDDRYARADARALYPSWWRLHKIRAGKAGEQAGAPSAEAGRLAL
ncbi:MAG: DinG family ATP-dependent helicase, partial [Paucimonas sp.]|nr:DinG family ATP-dependent helicase [Paucimonas sp.]